jgi:hypothetical protein
MTASGHQQAPPGSDVGLSDGPAAAAPVSDGASSRFLASGDEAGTAPGDRKFRPDVEGLRAVAVVMVVLYHANVPKITGGYVGVDVFFVLSGFVITGLLLRERAATEKTRLLDFYGRRCRRILPAATLVIVPTTGWGSSAATRTPRWPGRLRCSTPTSI